jgi:hypothetical protein
MTDNVNTVAKLKKNDKKTNERSTKYYTENKILHIKQNTTQKTKDYTENKILHRKQKTTQKTKYYTENKRLSNMYPTINDFSIRFLKCFDSVLFCLSFFNPVSKVWITNRKQIYFNLIQLLMPYFDYPAQCIAL